jgi:calcineurin-like phosphoesterase family protein
MVKRIVSFNRKLDETKNYFITSDLHFYHKNIMNFCQETRPYRDVEEMHSSMILHWNSVVSEDDIVFHLGDFSFSGYEKTKKVLDQLKGNIIFILGNHDKVIRTQMRDDEYQKFDYLELKYKSHKIIMSHYPIACWNGQGRGSLHFHGHSHGNYKSQGRILDVGWDSAGKILTLDEAVSMVCSKDVYVNDHHKII